MKTPRSQVAGIIAKKALKTARPKLLSKEIAAYLLSEHRVNELDSVMRDVQLDWAEAGYVEVMARSARPLSAIAKAGIKQRVKQVYPNAKRITISEQIDPGVMGGARLSLPGQQLDLSVEAKMNQLRQLTTGKD